jgi:hypothetical protein
MRQESGTVGRTKQSPLFTRGRDAFSARLSLRSCACRVIWSEANESPQTPRLGTAAREEADLATRAVAKQIRHSP